MNRPKFLLFLLCVSIGAFFGGCDNILLNHNNEEYDSWYYAAEGYEGSPGSEKPTAISILGGITDIDGWTIDTGNVSSKWRSKTYYRPKGLARLDIGFSASILDLHWEIEGRIDMHIYVNGEQAASAKIYMKQSSNGGYISSFIGDPTGYSVKYRGNWTTGGHPPVDATIYREGDLVVIKSNEGNLQKIGSILTGWNTQADGYGQSWDFGDVGIMPDGNVVLYAEWERETP
ncbi:MAG: InlB B-repeat-containing protein [Candidatus Shapirobacteria bacterium]|jgi:hypothetical protein